MSYMCWRGNSGPFFTTVLPHAAAAASGTGYIYRYIAYIYII